MTAHVRADAIVVAAGTSRRMEGIDKLELAIAGRPLLAWALAAVAAAPEVERIVLVAPASRVATLRDAGWLPASVVAACDGGERRQDSVRAGVAALAARDGELADAADRVVLVHDGARPLVRPALVSRVAAAAARFGAAIPVVSVGETLKRVDGDLVTGTVDRDGLATAQTPQGVRRSIVDAALREVADRPDATWTDEAALLEACRIAVHALPGDPTNLKVTLPADLERVAAVLAGPAARVGLGHDSHPFGPGGPLALGGIEIEDAPRLYGHSDGDVVLHAVADALLGAAGLGDLGRLFPADTRTPRGVASRTLLGDVVARLDAAGHRPTGIDVTIVAARPRIASRLDEMADALASLTRVDRSRVNVKASTGNLEGAAGAGRGIEAHVVATIASPTGRETAAGTS